MNLAPHLAFSRRTLIRHKFQAAVLVAGIVAAASAHLGAQQPYPYPAQPQSPYGYGQYAAPAQPYGDPQYGDQQYAQPQNAQPEYGQPQYSQQPPELAEQPAYPDPTDPDLGQMQPEPGDQQARPPLDAEDLEQLIAPIALYPDALLAQILTASTYPAQVSIADQWLRQMQAQGYGAPAMIASGADAQADWDPSIKALTAFPQVLDTLNQNLQWTTALGNAYYNQPDDVMQTVQVMRERAAGAGNLQSTPQESVSNDQGNIELAPPDPQEVYVPSYNPWDVYGQPISPYPGFSLAGALGSFFSASPVSYGLDFALSAFEQFPWGFLGWAFDWHSHDVLFGRDAYFTHSRSVADWGFPHGGERAFGRRGGYGDRGRYGDRGGYAGRGGYGDHRQWSRFSNGDRGAYNRAGNGFNRGESFNHAERPGQSFNRPGQSYGRPEQSYGRPAQQYNRPMQSPVRPQQSLLRPSQPYNRTQPFAGGYGYQRGYTSPAQQAYNRVQPNYARPQSYAGAGTYGRSPYGNANRPQNFATRPGMSYGSPSFQGPQRTAPRAFSQTPSRSFPSFGRNSSHGFGGGHFSAPKGFSGGGRSFSGGRSFGGGGGRSFGGGGHFSAPKASHFGGGGGHFGGSHSGGGGGHSGGGHHGR